MKFLSDFHDVEDESDAFVPDSDAGEGRHRINLALHNIFFLCTREHTIVSSYAPVNNRLYQCHYLLSFDYTTYVFCHVFMAV